MPLLSWAENDIMLYERYKYLSKAASSVYRCRYVAELLGAGIIMVVEGGVGHHRAMHMSGSSGKTCPSGRYNQ